MQGTLCASETVTGGDDFMRFFPRSLSALAVTATVTALLTPASQPVLAADSKAWRQASGAPGSINGDFALELRMAAAEMAYGRSAVNARVDRVWHAIPGLCGWGLDRSASVRATRQAHDGALHLVWRAVSPDKELSGLPAEPIYKGPDSERSVALMFNVSWGEEHIPKLLYTLREKHVFATFFLDGAWVLEHPELAREIERQGHAIGSHGSGHPDFRKLTTAKIGQQVATTNEVIQGTLHHRVRLLAPPAGAYDMRTVQAAHAAGMYTILWSVDSVDWKRPSSERIVDRVISGIHPGALVLLHPTEPTVAALPTLIDRLRADGYVFKTVAAMVDEQPAEHPPAVLSGPE